MKNNKFDNMITIGFDPSLNIIKDFAEGSTAKKVYHCADFYQAMVKIIDVDIRLYCGVLINCDLFDDLELRSFVLYCSKRHYKIMAVSENDHNDLPAKFYCDIEELVNQESRQDAAVDQFQLTNEELDALLQD